MDLPVLVVLLVITISLRPYIGDQLRSLKRSSIKAYIRISSTQIIIGPFCIVDAWNSPTLVVTTHTSGE